MFVKQLGMLSFREREIEKRRRGNVNPHALVLIPRSNPTSSLWMEAWLYLNQVQKTLFLHTQDNALSALYFDPGCIGRMIKSVLTTASEKKCRFVIISQLRVWSRVKIGDHTMENVMLPDRKWALKHSSGGQNWFYYAFVGIVCVCETYFLTHSLH